MSSEESCARKPKRRRATQACDYCHGRAIKCLKPTSDGPCQNCKDFAQPCTYHRQPRRRGVQPRASVAISSASFALHGTSDANGMTSDEPGASPSLTGSSNPDRAAYRTSSANESEAAWKAPFVASQATIVDLVELFFEIVYPIFPLFHRPSFTRQISRAEYMTDKRLFTGTMAVCSLVSSRVRDGAVTNPRWNTDSFGPMNPDIFTFEAERHLSHNMDDSSLHIIRAHAILAIAAIQNGRNRELQKHLGTYHMLMDMDGLHDESNWPRSIGIIEREERRRLFWSIYTLDVFTSVVWGSTIRSREQQLNISYPTEVDDEHIGDSGISHPNPGSLGVTSSFGNNSNPRSVCWISGWNFITDLYRILEHTLSRFRGSRCHVRRNSFLKQIFQDRSNVTESSVRSNVLLMYMDLPHCFKETPHMTYDIKRDIFGYQAANIQASLQLVRMVSLSAEDASIQERCQIASEVVNAFVSIPVNYLLAISTPLLHHLGEIGALLGTVLEEPLSESDYNQVRTVMLSMAQLLQNLELMHHGASASEKLRSQVSRIDGYMMSQRGASNLQGDLAAPSAIATQTIVGDRPPYGNQVGSAMNNNLSFTLPSDLLGDFTWNFDFG
ncbi:fungal-specific transcription factor domain-containing protein [Xylariomycetidae sp. FL2044]|nr:fungal-specific transcription factor domain-containing protein [Xylariomycetidae sp. FL2044]